GALGFPAWRFFVANVTGAVIYVPIVVGAGWAVGYGLGDYLGPLRRGVVNAAHIGLYLVIALAAVLLLRRVIRAARSRRPDSRPFASPKPADPARRSSVPGMYIRSNSWKCATRAITWWLSVGWPAFIRSSAHCACSSFLASSCMAFQTEYIAAWAPNKVMKMNL